MLEITRTPDGRLLVSTNRFSEEVETEGAARRLLVSRGWGNLSITKALHRLKELEGTAAPLEAWSVRRPSGEPAPAPKSPPRVVAAGAAPVAETSRPSGKAGTRSRRKKTPGAAAEPVAETVETPPTPAPEPEKAPAPRKRRSRRRPEPVESAGAEEAVEATVAPAAEEVAPAPVPALEAEPPAAKPRRSRKKAQPAPAAEAAPAPTPEETQPAAEKKPRRAAARAKREPAAEHPDAAVHHAAELARALRERERATLPFARGPWTELRETAERVLACLEGREVRPGGDARP